MMVQSDSNAFLRERSLVKRGIQKIRTRLSEPVWRKEMTGCHGRCSGILNPLFKQAAFTLIEVMIAIAILAIGIGAILVAENNSLDVTLRAKRMTTVAMLAQNEIVQAERDLQGKTFDEVREETTGRFDAPFADFSWERKIKKITFPNLLAPNAKGDPKEDSSSSTGGTAGGNETDQGVERVVKIATNYLSKASREITITIKWKEKGEDQKYTVSQYWVDLNHEFQFSEDAN